MHAGSATKQPVKRVSKYFNFNNRERDKAFGFLFVYNYFHQFSNNTFLSVASELDTGFALFCFLATWRKFYCLQLILRCVLQSQPAVGVTIFSFNALFLLLELDGTDHHVISFF